MTGKQANTCSKCGFCLAVCPVYKVLSEEQVSPRAKIQLIKSYKEKNLVSSENLQEIISKCLMCGSCTANCPSDVNHSPHFMQMRSEMIKDHGDRIEIKGLVYTLAREQRLRLATSLAQYGQRFIPESLAQKYQIANIPVARFPRLNKRSFRSQIKENNPPVGKERGTVLYFTGCATQYLFEETGHATLNLLRKIGYRVIVPAKQTCCSIPMLFHGGEKMAQKNIGQNIDHFSADDVEAIIVDCPTCGSALKNEYVEMAEKYGHDTKAAQSISAKVVDIMSFLLKRKDLLELSRDKVDTVPVVTYHAPCHLKNVFSPADKLLEEIDIIEYRPAPDSTECCGGGGTFFYEHPEISSQLAETKIANALKTGADIWLTDCPVCKINLTGHIPEKESLHILHPIQLLDRLVT